MSRLRRPAPRLDIDARSLYVDELQINRGGRLRDLSGYGNNWFVRPQDGDDDYDGRTWDRAFASMSPLDTRLGHGDTIYLQGVLKQAWEAPEVNDVAIVGVAGKPRQATTSGVANGAGATWLDPGSGTDPLLHLGSRASGTQEQQGWSVENIFFNNARAAPCIKLNQQESGADSGHFRALGCYFNPSGGDGILSVGGGFHEFIDCSFYFATTSAKGAIQATAGAGGTLPLGWLIKGCRFVGNVRHIYGPLQQALITGNYFGYACQAGGVTPTFMVRLAGGADNIIMGNYMAHAFAASGIGAKYGTAGTNDQWLNYYTDALTTAIPSAG